MKHKLFLLAGIMALMMSCHSDIDELGVSSSSFMIRLDGELGETTRIDDNGFCDGDQIGLYGVNYTNSNSTAGVLLDEGNQVNNARYTYDGKNRLWNSTGSIYYKDANTNIDLYAYYPYGAPESVNDYAFEVAYDQTGEGVSDGYSKSDFLWGKTENVVPSNDKVKIRFSHRLSNAIVILTQGEGFTEGEFEALEKSVLVSNTIRTASIDLATGSAVADGEVSAEGIVMRATGDDFRAIVVPQTIKGGVALYTITVDGISYRFKPSNDFTFEAGKQSKFTIEVSKKSMTGEYEFALVDTDIVNWVSDIETHAGEARQYYVVHQEKSGTLGELIRADKKNPNKIKNLKIVGKIDPRDFGFMRDSMEILQAVNLKESEIVAGWSWNIDIYDGQGMHVEWFEGEMPSNHQDRYDTLKERYPDWDGGSTGYEPQACNANEIPAYAFGLNENYWDPNGKSSLVYFSFPEKVTKIGAWAFSGTMLSGALVIPNDVTEIGNGAFCKTNITSLELPHNLKSIGNDAFYQCKSLSGSLNLPESLESLGTQSFRDCSMLTGTFTIPSKLKEIPNDCFIGCSFTGSLIIPEGVVRIGSQAFHGQFNGQLSLPNSLKEIGDNAFGGCGFQGELFIPKQIQVIPDYCFQSNSFSNIVFAEGSELLKIGEAAFNNNQRITDPVVLPEGLTTIGNMAFGHCCGSSGNSGIQSVTIPSTVITIGDSAFANCYGFTSMVSSAVVPPILGSGVFNGVPKDNFTMEVPEQSVSRYQTAMGWSDFRRISAHHDFAISRSQLRTLNAEYSKTYILRAPAGLAWSIESKPDWVTVTPSSGVGKTEVKITVNEMAANDNTFDVSYNDQWGNSYTDTYNGRAGEIVFLLNDKDYRSTMKVEQYDYEHYDGEVIVNQKATKGKGVNLVFMGDCFDARDIATGKYLDGINEAIGYYFGIEPYKSYKEYFNVYTVVGMSSDSGVGTVNTIKEAKFGSQYALEGIQPDVATTFEYAMKAETVNENNINQSLVVMVENTEDYGGICYMWCDGSAIAICPMSRDAYPFDFRGIVQHEAGGHGFAKLADEYIYHNAFIESCKCCCCYHLPEFYAGKACGWYRNLSTNGDMKTVEWSHLIFHPDYSNIVDMYEGGFYHTRGIYRSEANSCMNNNIPYYSAIQRQEMVERIKRYAGEEFSLEDFYAKDVRDASNNDFTTRGSLEVEDTAASRASAAKQMPPKIMGDKPIIK